MIRLKELRVKNHLTQIDTANALNIPLSAYIGYEIGLYDPNIALLIRIADYFCISIDELINNSSVNAITYCCPSNESIINNIYAELNTEGKELLLMYAKYLVGKSKIKVSKS